jgi:hypothetical protein
VVGRDGKIAYKSGPGLYGFHPKEVAKEASTHRPELKRVENVNRGRRVLVHSYFFHPIKI